MSSEEDKPPAPPVRLTSTNRGNSISHELTNQHWMVTMTALPMRNSSRRQNMHECRNSMRHRCALNHANEYVAARQTSLLLFCNALICPNFNQFTKINRECRHWMFFLSFNFVTQGFSKSDHHHRSDSAPAVELKPLPKGIICTVFCQLCYSANEISH